MSRFVPKIQKRKLSDAINYEKYYRQQWEEKKRRNKKINQKARQTARDNYWKQQDGIVVAAGQAQMTPQEMDYFLRYGHKPPRIESSKQAKDFKDQEE